MDYEGIMNNIMKTLCVFGISNQHNIHNLKNRQKSGPFQTKNALIKSSQLAFLTKKCPDKVQPISNEKCAGKVQLRRMKNEQ